MSRRPPRRFTVLAKTLLTPNMWRITLGGDGMIDFPPDQATAHIKLHFAQAHSARPLLRTYTVRAQRPEAIDVDVVRHVHGGPAARWAETVAPGETIDIGGPGPTKRIDANADRCLLVGDMTALPAIGANIEALSRHVRGHAIVEVIAEDDIQPLDAPPGLSLDWLVNPFPGERPALLVDAVRTLPRLADGASVWAACEFTAMRHLRSHLLDDRAVGRHALYISSYWQCGHDETRHKASKRADADA